MVATNLMRGGALALCLAASAPAGAEGPVGIAHAQAPERSSGTCTGSTPERAFACARERCAREGVRAGECRRVAWCYPALWSAEVFVQDANGAHWHEFSCGWPSRELAEQAARLRCDPAQRPGVQTCTTVRLFDPAGAELSP